jgi:hypothetical protein
MTRHPLHARCGYSQFNLSGEGLTSSRWHHCRPTFLETYAAHRRESYWSTTRRTILPRVCPFAPCS